MRLGASSAPLTIVTETFISSLGSSLTPRDKDRHGFLRRTFNPMFSQTFLNELEPTIKYYLQKFMDVIVEETMVHNGIVNVSKWIDYFTFDVTNLLEKLRFEISGALSLGEDFKALETKKYDAIMKSISDRWKFISQVNRRPLSLTCRFTQFHGSCR